MKSSSDPSRTTGIKRHEAFSAVFVGEGSLLVRCAEVFLDAGHQIRGVVSSKLPIQRWAEENMIPYVAPTDNVVGFMSRVAFDYLFSVVNPSVLPKEILALPRKLGVNFHDALLPKYAGTHATTWALINGEQTHGVTWHEMTEHVDAGRILKQRAVDLSEDETTFSLNVKCYEAGIQSFAELTADISSGRLAPNDPRLHERTYFSKYRRPDSAAVISWDRPAEEIKSLVQALTFGPDQNPMGLAKIYLGEEAIIMQEVDILNAPSRVAPGTVTDFSKAGIHVATGSRDIVLRALLTIDGQSLPVGELEHRFDVRVGQRLAEIGREQAECLTALNNNLAEHERFWVRALSRFEPICLPYAHRSASSVGPARQASAPIAVSNALAAWAGRLPGWDVGDLLIATFAVYLSRLGDKWEFDLGFSEPALRQELGGLQSLFATQVPLHVNFGQENSIGEALQAVLNAIMLVRTHKTYARDVIGRYPELSSLPTQGGQPSYSVAAEYVEDMDSYELQPGSELVLIVAPNGSAVRWVYDLSVFAADTVALMQRQFAQVLRLVAENLDRPLSDLPLLSDEERLRILVEWNDTQTDYPRDRCVHELFEEQAEKTPGAVALVFEDQQLTFQELNRWANRLARHLRKMGVGPEVLVGVCMERSVEMVVGLLGILKAGGAYVPMDPAYPKERLSFMIQDTRVPVLLTQERLLARLPEHRAQAVCLDDDYWLATARGEREENPISGATATNLAYAIYTSGSTGTPKGVVVEHRSVVRLVRNTNYLEFGSDDVFLQLASLSFDASTFEFWGPLLNGGRLVLAPPNRLSLAELSGVISHHKVTTLWLTAGLFHQLVEDNPSALSNIRNLLAGGDILSPKHVREALRHLPRTRLINGYGPTENTTFTCCFPMTADAPPPDGPIPIGTPIANTRVYILDVHRHPVPIGVTGELYTGGDGLARGYLNHPELTAEKFIPDPFSDNSGARLYKTGDLARYLPNGNIEFLGRLDHQVKIRGFRIEPGEVEAVLRKHPAVRAAVVVARKDETGGKSLVAYYVASSRWQARPTSELRAFVESKLPEQMVPSVFVLLETLPLTTNGKVDREALPALEGGQRSNLEVAFVAPSNELEELLAGIWSEVLGRPLVGIQDNFFELGGHSLLATQVISRLRNALQVELSLRDIFEAPTVALLAQLLTSINNADEPATPSRPSIVDFGNLDERRS